MSLVIIKKGGGFVYLKKKKKNYPQEIIELLSIAV